jgi:hypothetical protein
MLRWNMTTDYDVEGGMRIVCCVVVLNEGKGHRESPAGFFYFLSCWLRGGSSLRGAATKLLIFLRLLLLSFRWDCIPVSLRRPIRWKQSLQLFSGLALPAVCLQNGVSWRNDLEITKMVVTDQMWHLQPTYPKWSR